MNVVLCSTHFDGTPHRRWEVTNTTADAWSFAIAPGAPVREADGHIWASDYWVVAWFWPDVFYQVFLLLKDTGTEYYCNIITPPVYIANKPEIAFADLELDVRLDANGLWVADEDEFAARQVDYPKSVVSAARAAKDRLTDLGAARRGPFSQAAAARWRAVLALTPCS